MEELNDPNGRPPRRRRSLMPGATPTTSRQATLFSSPKAAVVRRRRSYMNGDAASAATAVVVSASAAAASYDDDDDDEDGITDLLIVGAGPAGLVAALEALRLGLTFRIIDAAAARHNDEDDEGGAKSKSGIDTASSSSSSSMLIHPRVMELLEPIGNVVAKIAMAGQQLDQVCVHHSSQQIETLHLSRDVNWGDTAYPYFYLLPQSELERILKEELTEQHGCKIEYGVCLQDIQYGSKEDNIKRTQQVNTAPPTSSETIFEEDEEEDSDDEGVRAFLAMHHADHHHQPDDEQPKEQQQQRPKTKRRRRDIPVVTVTLKKKRNDDLLAAAADNMTQQQEEESKMVCHYVLGCDGVNSTTRHLIAVDRTKPPRSSKKSNLLYIIMADLQFRVSRRPLLRKKNSVIIGGRRRVVQDQQVEQEQMIDGSIVGSSSTGEADKKEEEKKPPPEEDAATTRTTTTATSSMCYWTNLFSSGGSSSSSSSSPAVDLVEGGGYYSAPPPKKSEKKNRAIHLFPHKEGVGVLLPLLQQQARKKPSEQPPPDDNKDRRGRGGGKSSSSNNDEPTSHYYRFICQAPEKLLLMSGARKLDKPFFEKLVLERTSIPVNSLLAQLSSNPLTTTIPTTAEEEGSNNTTAAATTTNTGPCIDLYLAGETATLFPVTHSVSKLFHSKQRQVFLLGNAAHSHSTLGGANNHAMMDSLNLLWKIAWAKRCSSHFDKEQSQAEEEESETVAPEKSKEELRKQERQIALQRAESLQLILHSYHEERHTFAQMLLQQASSSGSSSSSDPMSDPSYAHTAEDFVTQMVAVNRKNRSSWGDMLFQQQSPLKQQQQGWFGGGGAAARRQEAMDNVRRLGQLELSYNVDKSRILYCMPWWHAINNPTFVARPGERLPNLRLKLGSRLHKLIDREHHTWVFLNTEIPLSMPHYGGASVVKAVPRVLEEDHHHGVAVAAPVPAIAKDVLLKPQVLLVRPDLFVAGVDETHTKLWSRIQQTTKTNLGDLAKSSSSSSIDPSRSILATM